VGRTEPTFTANTPWHEFHTEASPAGEASAHATACQRRGAARAPPLDSTPSGRGRSAPLHPPDARSSAGARITIESRRHTEED